MPILWTNALSVNNKEIDSQHKHLVDLFNDYEQTVADGNDRDVCHEFWDDFMNYAKVHLSFEEDLMRQYKYPLRHNHEEEHEQLMDAATKVMDACSTPSNATEHMSQFLQHWLQNHIVASDKVFCNFINNAGA